MLLVALLDTYDSALNKCTKYSCKVFLFSSYISSLFLNGLICMKESPVVLRLSALLNKPCRKLDRLDKTHSDSTHSTKRTMLFTCRIILIITVTSPDVCQEIGE